MVGEIGVTVNTKAFSKRVGKTIPRHLNAEVKRALDRIGGDFTAIMSRNRLRGRPGLKRQTGALARSQNHHVSGSRLSNLRMVYRIGGNEAPYARIHETGGVIRAKNSPFLVFKIPGVGFRSVRQVTIPPRLGFRTTWKKRRRQRAMILQRALRDALKKKGG